MDKTIGSTAEAVSEIGDGADALGQRSLRHQFKLDFAGQIFVRESARIGRTRE